MEAKKRRSVLRKSTTVDCVSIDATPRIKRRISFSGKHLVREFQSEEEPKTWNNSYEISDHLHVDETAPIKICVSKNQPLRSALKKPHEDKENDVVQATSHSDSQNRRNVSVTNNSVLSTTRELINVSYKKYNIDNSVDITLFERELKYRVGGAEDDHTTTYTNSYSLDENEKELAASGFVETTVDFMRTDTQYNLNKDLTLQKTLNMRESSLMYDCTKNDVGGFTVYNEFTDGIENMEVKCAENKRSKELYTIYMNDSMSTSCNEQPTTGTKESIEKRKTIQRPVSMECSPINAKQCDKENIMPMALYANATINKSCYMEIDGHCYGPKIKVNVDRESREFHEKLDQLSFVEPTDDNMQMEITQTAEVCGRGGAIPKVKSRPTINFNQPIEFSPVRDKSNTAPRRTVNYNENMSEVSPVTVKSNTARQSVNCNEDIQDVSPVKFKTNPRRQTVNFLNEDINEDSPIKVVKSCSMRQTVNFLNEDINEDSPVKVVKSTSMRQTLNFLNEDINEDSPVKVVKSSSMRQTLNFLNEDINEDSPVKVVKSTSMRQTVNFPNEDINEDSPVKVVKSTSMRQTVNFLNEDINEDYPVKVVKSTSMRQTVNFNTDISMVSPATVKSNHLRQTVNFNEDMQVCPLKLSQETTTTTNGHQINKPATSIRKNGQPLVVRKICTPLVNKTKTQVELEQQRMLRFKKKLEQDVVSDNVKHDAADKPPTAINTINLSLSSVKNLSLSPESSSPLIPSEFKVYNLKQLNDELERGNLHVYSNAPKTPSTDRKKASSQFSKNLQYSESSNQRRTLVFDDADIPIAAADDTLTNAFKSIKSNDYFDLYTTHEPTIEREKKKNSKCRYSQADDIMLDNTSFLTQAKLGDETASRNSSKRDATQINNMDILYDEPLMEASMQLVGESFVKTPKGNLSMMHQDDEPIFRQPLSTRNDIEITFNIQNDKESIHSNGKKRHTMHLNHDIDLCDKTQKELENRTLVCNENHMDIEDESPSENANGKTVLTNNDMEIETEEVEQNQLKSSNDEVILSAKPLHSSTVFFKNDISNIDNENSEKIIRQQKKQNHPRHTLHFDNENIEYEEPSRGGMETMAGTFNDNDDDIDAETQNSPKVRNARQTLYLNRDIEADESHDWNIKNTKNVLDKYKESSNHLKPRHTMHFDSESIDCEVAHGNQNKDSHATSKTKQQSFNLVYNDDNDLNPKYFENYNVVRDETTGESARQNVHYNIDVTDADPILSNKDVETKVKTEKSRHTLLFHEDIDLETSNLDNQNNENQLSLVENTNDHHLDNEKRNSLHFQYNNDISMDLYCKASADNHNLKECNASNMNCTSPSNKSKRKTHYYDRNEANIENELSLSEKNASTCEYKPEMQSSCPDKRKTLHFNTNNNDISTEHYEIDKDKDHSSMNKRKTFHFEDNNDITIEQSGALAEAEYNKVPGSTERPLNAAKMSFLRQNSAITLQTTPRTNKSKYQNRMNEETPGMLAFIAEEMKSQMECEEFASPYRSKVSMKRLPVNLTPIETIVKKRQTLTFDDCNMDETLTSPQTHECSGTKALNDATQDLGLESVMVTTPLSTAKHRRSRIPIPLSSGRKSTKSHSLTDIGPAKTLIDCNEFVVNIDDGTDEELVAEEEEEEMDESLQMLRRATTFAERRNFSIEPKCHDTELEVKQSTGGQHALFEDNPITISDVSVFFTAQRKSNNDNTTVPLSDLTAAMPLNTINISGLNVIERNFQDIDETRLSLVRTLSDDDDDDEHDNDNENKIIVVCNDTYHEQSPETETETAKTTTDTVPFKDNCADSRVKIRSVNNLRSANTVCRKCERCQDTFLNETTSSTADSFVLPALPPLPDLGLDRLRRLRKRPTISDVNVLWQRVSLDRTMINPINISDDDCQIVSDAEEDISDEDESNPAFKALRKYHKERQEFEVKLIESIQEQKAALARQRPFVQRLEDLLSNNSNNWMFDYQKQVRGLFLFSHRKMLTFSVSLKFAEVDPFDIEINLKTVNLQQSHVPKKNWKAIDFILDFQLKLNLPYDLQSLCERSNEAGIFKMLQEIDRKCMETVKMGQALQRVVFSNKASIIRDQSRVYVRKIIRRIVNDTDNNAQHVQKMEIKIELLNLKKLSFKDISAPPLHYFREEIHLLPIGLQFLNAFLPNPLNYLTCTNNQ